MRTKPPPSRRTLAQLRTPDGFRNTSLEELLELLVEQGDPYIVAMLEATRRTNIHARAVADSLIDNGYTGIIEHVMRGRTDPNYPALRRALTDYSVARVLEDCIEDPILLARNKK